VNWLLLICPVDKVLPDCESVRSDVTGGCVDRVLHLHDNADLACVPMPKGFVDSPTYSGPDACKVPLVAMCCCECQCAPALNCRLPAGHHDAPSFSAQDDDTPAIDPSSASFDHDAAADAAACSQDRHFCPVGCGLAVHKGA
jgi:hypothetical protein